MTRFTFASHPFLLGFEELDRQVERVSRAGNNAYPPYNIEARDSDAYRIVLAVAGYSIEQLSITIEDGQLTIRGTPGESTGSGEFLHRGIAAREFRRSFVLDQRVEVSGATLERGLLTIDLVRRQPEREVRTVRISKPRDEGEAG